MTETNVVCKDCTEHQVDGIYLFCPKRQWKIAMDLAKKQRLCDDEEDC